MERTLRILNELEREGMLGRYAIGGGVAAIYYMEPFLTYDLDIITVLPQTEAGVTALEPLYAALRGRGCTVEGDTVEIAGVPVQFLPAYNPLVEEALQAAHETTYEETPTRVLRAEHLLAIMLQTGRDKDRQRFSAFREEAQVDADYLADILTRHGLSERWQEWSA